MIVVVGCGLDTKNILKRDLRIYMSAEDDQYDSAIIAYIKREYNCVIGERFAEEIRLTIGPNAGVAEETTMEIKGRCLESCLLKSLSLNSREICALSD